MANKLAERTMHCLVCGTPSNQRVLLRPDGKGTRDLDFRPGGHERAALPLAVQRCPGCGYCGDSIGRVPGGIEQEQLLGALHGDIYRARLHDPDQPDLARHFRCQSLILAMAGHYAEAGQAMLSAAWAADDIGAAEAARESRKSGAELFAIALSEDLLPDDRTASVRLVIIDMLRRSGQWLQAGNACRHLRDATAEPSIRGVAAYQAALIEARDDRAHGFDEALPAESADVSGGRNHLVRLIGLLLGLLATAALALGGLKGF